MCNEFLYNLTYGKFLLTSVGTSYNELDITLSNSLISSFLTSCWWKFSQNYFIQFIRFFYKNLNVSQNCSNDWWCNLNIFEYFWIVFKKWELCIILRKTFHCSLFALIGFCTQDSAEFYIKEPIRTKKLKSFARSYNIDWLSHH